jgi:alanyl-tRNA synthetase
MTRLERDDPYRLSFESVLEGVRTDADGTWWRLRASAFYATGGGQPHDEGTLHLADDAAAGGAAAGAGASWRVVGVESDDDAAVWHRVEGSAAAPSVGTAIRGDVDGVRRWRHMQRHSAQHLLSQAFVRVDASFATRSVALHSPDVTIDLAGDPDDEAVAAAFRLANEVASRALPVRVFEVDERELGAYPLRRPAKVSGRVRLVAMGDWEVSACGGTHVRSTAEVLPLLALGRERIRGGLVRVTFRAGLEAIERAHATQSKASEAARALSAAVDDLPDRVRALTAEAGAVRRELAHARSRLAQARAAAMVGAPGEVLALTLSDDDGLLATDLADAIAALGATAVIGARQGEAGALVLASGAGVDVRSALRAGLEPLAGRGGGRPERAQGAGPRLEALPEAVELARSVLCADTGGSPA